MMSLKYEESSEYANAINLPFKPKMMIYSLKWLAEFELFS